MNPKFFHWLLPFLALIPTSRALTLVPEKIPAIVPDKQSMQMPDAVHLHGWLGQRVEGNEKRRLLNIDIDQRLLDPYRHRSLKTGWDGEHVGKWLHAATLAWAHSGDPALRGKLDFVVTELEKCQLEDGYLGTYLPEKHWVGWDLWSHKYNLIGLLTYVRYTGNLEPLGACRKMGDLLCKTYGDEPGKITIIQGPHKGLAYGSVLEPMVELYRLTGEPRYLDFCRYILRAWEQPDGPKIVSTLLTLRRVDKVGNGKAYEMLSCLNSLLELYRVNSERPLLEAALNAWQDIVENRLYLTGTASARELFRGDHDLPNTGNVGETCVTVTWLQFNAQLLRLTGEARFAEELERTALNQLIGAQAPDCDAWGYYVEMEGKKPYRTALLGHCCLSSGPRGLALLPTFASSTDADGAVVVNLYEAGTARLSLPDRNLVTLTTETDYPAGGHIRITVSPATAGSSFAVKLRVPAWSPGAPIRVNGEPQPAALAGPDGYASLPRVWKSGDVVELDLNMAPRVVVGDHTNAGKVAFLYGPLVLAADDSLLPGAARELRQLVVPGTDLKSLDFAVEPAPDKTKTWSGARVFRFMLGVRPADGAGPDLVPQEIRLVPFGDAGGSNGHYQVWLPLASPAGGNALGQSVSSASTGGEPVHRSATPGG